MWLLLCIALKSYSLFTENKRENENNPQHLTQIYWFFSVVKSKA